MKNKIIFFISLVLILLSLCQLYGINKQLELFFNYELNYFYILKSIIQGLLISSSIYFLLNIINKYLLKNKFENKIIERIYLTIWYGFSSFILIYFNRNTNFIPHILGGSSVMNFNNFNKFGNNVLNLISQKTYLFSIGHHSFRLLSILFLNTKPGEEYDYLMHDSWTIYLIFSSYICRNFISGYNVLVVHDFTDVILNICLISKNIKSNILKLFIYVILLIIWVYFRIYFMGYTIYYTICYMISLFKKPEIYNLLYYN